MSVAQKRPVERPVALVTVTLSVPVLFWDSLLGCDRSGSEFTASASWPRIVCVYMPIVKFISLCLIISLATFGWTPDAASKLPQVCLRLWKSAYRPASSMYSIPASFRSGFSILTTLVGIVNALAAGSLLASRSFMSAAVSGRSGNTFSFLFVFFVLV